MADETKKDKDKDKVDVPNLEQPVSPISENPEKDGVESEEKKEKKEQNAPVDNTDNADKKKKGLEDEKPESWVKAMSMISNKYDQETYKKLHDYLDKKAPEVKEGFCKLITGKDATDHAWDAVKGTGRAIGQGILNSPGNIIKLVETLQEKLSEKPTEKPDVPLEAMDHQASSAVEAAQSMQTPDFSNMSGVADRHTSSPELTEDAQQDNHYRGPRLGE